LTIFDLARILTTYLEVRGKRAKFCLQLYLI